MAQYQGSAGGGSITDEDIKRMLLASQTQPISNPVASVAGGALGGALGGATAGAGGVIDDGAGGGQSFQDFMSSAMGMYQPQFDYLDKTGAAAKSNAATSTKQLQAMYGAMAKDIYAQKGGINSNYNQGIAQTDAAYKQGLGQLTGAFDNSMNGTAAILQRLGIQEAAPNAIGEQSNMRALLSSIMRTNGQASSNQLREGRSSAQTFNTQQGNAAKLMGGEAQTGLQKQLNDFLNQLGSQRANLMGQVNQSAMGMQQSASQQASDDQKFLYQQAKDKADLDYKYDALNARDAATGSTARLDPLGEVNRLAMGLYGNQQGAQNAVKAVTDAWEEAMSNGSAQPTLATLIEHLKTRNQHLNGGNGPGDWSNLVRIATQLLGTK